MTHPDLTEIVHAGFTHDELNSAFTLIQDETNWKLPVDSWVDPEDADVAIASIGYFAGGGAAIVDRHELGDVVKVRIQAPGYYALIGA